MKHAAGNLPAVTMTSMDETTTAGWRAAGGVLALVLLFAFLNPLLSAYLNPLLSAYTPVSDISGSEAILVVAAWLFAIVGSMKVHAIDAVIVGLFTWGLVSAAFNGVPATAGILQVALLVCPFVVAKIMVTASPGSMLVVKRTLIFLVAAQVVMMLFQFATHAGIDDLKGTFVGTQYGEHVASLVVLVGATIYTMSGKRGWKGPAAIGVAMGLAFLADSKVALVYFLTVGVLYVLIGAPLVRVRSTLRPLWRVFAGVAGLVLIWAVYTGALGNIALSGYVEQTTQTGGGKVAVTKMIASPESQLWADEDMLIGAGPGQTVSRTAGLTVPTSVSPIPPASRLGIPPAEYYAAMEVEASGYGYIASSSVTKAASSLLGILGDLGVIGLALYLVGFFWVARQVAARSGWRSWPALAWLGLLVPGFVGEWLEFPPATMFLAVATLWLVIARPRETQRMPRRNARPAT